ncbi:MAG: T9SS type A sorting domain-containing protein [Candidatus Kapaibacteriota bacterium]
MRKVTYILVIIISVYYLNAQEIFIVRTDVDTSRSSFVTATHNFSFKVKLKDIKNCTAISFVLRHNQTNNINFSNFRTYPFSRNGSVFVYPWYNPVDGFVRIFTGILNGDTIGGKGEDNPEAIEFEFSVSADAPNLAVVEFIFEDAEAVVTENGIGKIIKLKSQPTLLNIHGFVDVWPGDANNDGIVNINDVSTVALYLGYGPSKQNFRSFQRLKASTDWFAQIALGWDSLAVTYADCDGDGEVTINDMLVIPLNFGKTHQLLNTAPNEETDKALEVVSAHNESTIPFTVLADEPIVGFVGEIAINDYFYQPSNSTWYTQKFDNNMCFVKSVAGPAGYFLVCGSTNAKPINNKTICISNCNTTIIGKGITSDGSIIEAKMTPVSTLSNTEHEFDLPLLLSSVEFPVTISIYNLLGETIQKTEISSVYEILNKLEELTKGVYFLKFTTQGKVIFTRYFK